MTCFLHHLKTKCRKQIISFVPPLAKGQGARLSTGVAFYAPEISRGDRSNFEAFTGEAVTTDTGEVLTS